MADPYIPIATLALELGQPVDALIARLGDAVIHDNIGMRVISRETAAAVLDEHAVKQRAERERQWAVARRLADGARGVDQTRARIRAIKDAQESVDLQLGDLSLTDAAYAVLTYDHHQARQEASAAALDEMLAGGAMTYHRKD